MRLKSLVLSLLLLVGLSFSLSAIEVATSDWEKLKVILQTLKTDNESLQSLLTESKSQLTLAQKELTMLKQSLNETESSLTKLKTSLQSISDQSIFYSIVAVCIGLALGVLLSP